jgi:hypothetical protein
VGLDDQEEKWRQAREWLNSPLATQEQTEAAVDYVLWRLRKEREARHRDALLPVDRLLSRKTRYVLPQYVQVL